MYNINILTALDTLDLFEFGSILDYQDEVDGWYKSDKQIKIMKIFQIQFIGIYNDSLQFLFKWNLFTILYHIYDLKWKFEL